QPDEPFEDSIPIGSGNPWSRVADRVRHRARRLREIDGPCAPGRCVLDRVLQHVEHELSQEVLVSAERRFRPGAAVNRDAALLAQHRDSAAAFGDDFVEIQLDVLNRAAAGIGSHVELYLDEIVDRKSTRLNSSHVAISYAVFCLKKKK